LARLKILVIARVMIAIEERQMTAKNFQGVFFPTLRANTMIDIKQMIPPVMHIGESPFFRAAVISVIAIIY